MMGRWLLLGTMLLAACGDAIAGVTAERTRVIFPQGRREASLLVVNQNSYPVVVQAWIDDGDPESSPDIAQAPIIPLPGMFRLEAGQQQSLRLLYVGPSPQEDRESLYWLNIYEIPPRDGDSEVPDQSRLTITTRTQMKVIYRPSKLKGAEGQAAAKVEFRVHGGRLLVDNPTPYYLTISGVRSCRQGTQLEPVNEGLVPPLSRSTRIGGEDCPVWGGEVSFSWIDDDGNSQPGRAVLRRGP